MRQERFNEPHKQGLERLTGDNTGIVYANERTETEADSETGKEKTVWVYDVYEVHDARDPHKVKNDVINGEHPFGDELKILRKSLAKLLKAQGVYDDEEYAEFRAYNEFCESI